MPACSPPHLRAAVPSAPPGWRGVATRVRLHTARAVLLLTALGLFACGGKKGAESPNAQSTERQSEAEYDVARDFFQKGQPRAALDHAMKAVSLDARNDKAQYLVAAIHLSFCSSQQGFEAPDCRLDEVEKHARAALAANPEFRDATNLLGQVLINQKRYREAIAVLEPLTRDPAYVHPYFAWGNLGWAQVLEGNLDAGIASLRNAVAEPRFCVGHYRLGVAHEKKGELTLAETAFSSALSVPDPQCEDLQDAWEARGRVRQRLGRPEEARQDYERCRDISVETPTGKSCAKQLATVPGGGSQSAPAGGSAASASKEDPLNDKRKT
jgi:type IV pilus assembly protein PilF